MLLHSLTKNEILDLFYDDKLDFSHEDEIDVAVIPPIENADAFFAILRDIHLADNCKNDQTDPIIRFVLILN